MSRRFYSEKLRHAAHLLFFRRGRLPGVKGWELKKRLGKDHEEVMKQLNEILKDVDLEVKEIPEESSELQTSRFEESRFVVALKENLTLSEGKMCGWRIDNLAGLTIAISYVVSKQGKAPRGEVEKILSHKFGRWRSLTMMDAFTRTGYLAEDEPDIISLGWRAKAEVDLKSLMTLLLETKPI